MDLLDWKQEESKTIGVVTHVALVSHNGKSECVIADVQTNEHFHDIRVRAALNQGHKKEKEPLEAMARRYRSENPKVWEMFCRFAGELKDAGRTMVGVSLIWERLRWETMVSGNDGFKANNNYRAYFARWLMEERSEFKDFFSTRETTKERDQRLATPA